VSQICFLCWFIFFSHLISNVGVVYVNGKQVAGVRLPIAAGTNVLEGLDHGHQAQVKEFYTLHLDVLVMQMEFPNLRGLPLVDVTSVGADGRRISVAHLTSTSSGYHNWPCAQVGGAECCVLSLLSTSSSPNQKSIYSKAF
jgi:hypothetical protein